MQAAARTGVDPGQTLAAFLEHIGDRCTRGIDPTSTYDPYAAASSCGSCRHSATCP
jgi:hypothetical protein